MPVDDAHKYSHDAFTVLSTYTFYRHTRHILPNAVPTYIFKSSLSMKTGPVSCVSAIDRRVVST